MQHRRCHLHISEIFESIQGEGPWIGYPVTFVRTYGCNLNCPFCDTSYAKGPHCSYFEYTIDGLVDVILKTRPNFIVFTGGEPTLQMDELRLVIKRIKNAAPLKSIALETNGTLEIDTDVFDVIVVSPKSMSVVHRWCSVPNVYMKFLVENEDDLDDVKQQIDANTFSNIPYVMPIGTHADEIKEVSKRIVDAVISKRMDVILSPRLHVLMEVK